MVKGFSKIITRDPTEEGFEDRLCLNIGIGLWEEELFCSSHIDLQCLGIAEREGMEAGVSGK